MSGVNKAILVGHVGADPEIKTTQGGNRFALFSLATGETWRDKTTGERREKTQWHRVAVWNEGLIGIVEKYVKKGSKLYVEGSIEYQEYEKAGERRFATNITLKSFGASIQLLDRAEGGGRPDPVAPEETAQRPAGAPRAAGNADVNDEIPF